MVGALLVGKLALCLGPHFTVNSRKSPRLRWDLGSFMAKEPEQLPGSRGLIAKQGNQGSSCQGHSHCERQRQDRSQRAPWAALYREHPAQP